MRSGNLRVPWRGISFVQACWRSFYLYRDRQVEPRPQFRGHARRPLRCKGNSVMGSVLRPIVPSVWNRSDTQFAVALESPWYRQISEVYSVIYFASVDFFRARHYVPALVPITTGSISSPMGPGSDSEPVKIRLHERETYLADSMQFALEYYLRQGHSGSFYIMTSFRGEDSDARHLNQFYHAEAEIIGGLDDVMELVEDYVTALCRAVLASSISVQHDRLEKYLASGRPLRIEVDEALAELAGEPSFVRSADDGESLITAAGERELLRRHRSEGIWLVHPSRTTSPFYQATNPDRPNRVLAADLLIGIGETVGCGERHARAEEVVASLRLQHVNPEPYDWYLRLKREYPLRTAGFGLGVERFLLWVLGHDDIRDIHPIPRLKDEDWPL
ncbi:hypothetical protein ELH19_14285 [Rhizobium ruizarguesonis]|nr:hypothetical protein ELI04_13745 [Rhizobium leguminosarum]TBD43305.1 hypothetical protein ELH19_14285 [Rhizobium ruizarguesonis]